MVDDFFETAKVIWILLKVRNPMPIGNVPKRPNHGHERGLARAVLAHEEGQWRQAGNLLVVGSSESS